jgi:hypothetical protein
LEIFKISLDIFHGIISSSSEIFIRNLLKSPPPYSLETPKRAKILYVLCLFGVSEVPWTTKTINETAMGSSSIFLTPFFLLLSLLVNDIFQNFTFFLQHLTPEEILHLLLCAGDCKNLSEFFLRYFSEILDIFQIFPVDTSAFNSEKDVERMDLVKHALLWVLETTGVLR